MAQMDLFQWRKDKVPQNKKSEILPIQTNLRILEVLNSEMTETESKESIEINASECFSSISFASESDLIPPDFAFSDSLIFKFLSFQN
jgi:hypothetical protein